MNDRMSSISQQILRSRRELPGLFELSPERRRTEDAAEGGCGVLGLAANVPVSGRHVLTASTQMHNRGNGKGGGIAMVGLDPAQARCGPGHAAQSLLASNCAARSLRTCRGRS